jgi:epoxyqueuosine reductase
MTRRPDWSPSAEQMALWPTADGVPISGNTINGVGEAAVRQPTPVYWHAPDATPHGPLQLWFYSQMTPLVAQARADRIKANELQIPERSGPPLQLPAAEWTRDVKAAALATGAELVGITRMQRHWVYEGYDVPQQWIIMLGIAHDWDALRTAPEETAAADVIRQYARGMIAAKQLAAFIRARGHDATPLGGPMAFPMLLIPPAIEAGFGELGKHGSIINRTLGSNFRLAAVLTDIPLVADTRDDFGADDFCTLCKACATSCPPEAISHEKTLVRGEVRWSVDFDRCLPFFNEHQGCAACLAACPWSHPGVADNLLIKMAVRRSRTQSTG